ncbi:hypothetical protein CRG98_022566 [Punica granatum]|uniref:Uncharacterized protein n=1 Tax=Punica granatum TaxID=22663 RepID=A0A2I0JLB2_PUNGR|nr:hypothetical protein CRG98_022566 [Punica granatum]
MGEGAADRQPRPHHRGHIHPQRTPATMKVGSGSLIGGPYPQIDWAASSVGVYDLGGGVEVADRQLRPLPPPPFSF